MIVFSTLCTHKLALHRKSCPSPSQLGRNIPSVRILPLLLSTAASDLALCRMNSSVSKEGANPKQQCQLKVFKL